MSTALQMKLVEWSPSEDEQMTLFSVYVTATSVELHPGCDRRYEARLICTHKGYEEAYEFCELLADEFQLPLADFTSNRPS